MASILLVRNSGAGSAEGASATAAVRALRSGADVEECTPDDDADLQRLLDRRGNRVLVVAGGDGTLHRVVQALHRRGELSDVPLGLVPMGTGNDFARGSGIPLEVADAARLILTGTVRPVDLVVDDLGDVVVNNVHLGVGAEASRKGAAWKERVGRIGYAIGMVQASAHRAFRLQVELDGERVADGDHPILEVSIGNGATVGGGLPLNPGADPGDGKLDVIVAFATGPWRRVTYALDLARGRHPQRRDVLRRRVERVTVTGTPFHTSADGEISGPEPRRSWRVAPGAIRMILPTQ